MPYLGSDILRQWRRQYKYLLKIQRQYGTLTFEQQKQWDRLVPIFEGGNNADDLRNHGAPRIGEEHLG